MNATWGGIKKNTTEQINFLSGMGLLECDWFVLIEVFMYCFTSHVACPV